LIPVNCGWRRAPILQQPPNPQEQDMEHVSTDKLMHDLRAVVGDTEELLKATAGQTGERVEKVRARVEDSLRTARVRMEDTGRAVEARARAASHEVDLQVHEHAWTAVGVAAGVGLVLGIVLGRR
jgi:ElaB/YqjD/DUF883 family membrane-anchored ribosome-binding protein